jgi:chloramphenicol 3-O-phosphotransferase
MAMDKGKIILLNGVSSSGKSTLGLALQDTLPEKYFLFSQDGFSESWPYKYWKKDHDGIYVETMVYMNRTIEMLAGSGINFIVDHLFLDNGKSNATGPIVLLDCVQRFWNFPILFVRVDCDIAELDRRERWRGNRDLGTAERQLKELYPNHTYDLIISTSAHSTIDCAEEITKAMAKVELFRSFTIMKSRIDAGHSLE